MKFIYFIFLLIFQIPYFLYSYNIDIYSPYLKSIPYNNDILFGFSINVFTAKETKEKSILVGAPLDTLKTSKENKTGALYSCPLTEEFSDCKQITFSESSEGSLLGYVVDSNSIDGSIYTCAPRFLKPYANVKYVEGMCWELNDKFQELELIINDECLRSIKKNSQNYEYRNCLTGGALLSLNNRHILLTSPYSNEGKGLLIHNNFNPNTNSRSSKYVEVEYSNSKYQLAGFSMSIGKIFRNEGIKTIVLGVPGISQYNLERNKIQYGHIVIMKMDQNSITHSNVIFGEQFGSGFGYSVLSMDLDGDGFDEIIVGAPFTDNNDGKAFIYWNIDGGSVNGNTNNIPVDLKSRVALTVGKISSHGQFGLSLENIGDINKDSIMDMAVGSPFDNDGSGAVYIFPGNRNQIIVSSQKIEGRMISPDLRGFGFSIFGRNEDLDSNKYPDILIGAAVSSHLVGLRTRSIIRVYAENIIQTSNLLLSYNLDNIQLCNYDGQKIPCMNVTVSLYYYYLHLNTCLSDNEAKDVSYQVELDLPYLKTSISKRVFFKDKSNILKGTSTMNCKLPNVQSRSTPKFYEIFFPANLFFNISVPIEVKLSWSVRLPDVPRRDFNRGSLTNLTLYPILEQKKQESISKIHFGAGCGPGSCLPVLTMETKLDLQKDGEDYLLYLGNISKFKLYIIIKNIASSIENRAYRTYIKLNFDSKNIIVSSNSPERRMITSTGFIYSVTSPLNPQESDSSTFEFSLSNDFIQSAKQFVYINISVEAMSPQQLIKPISLKIKMKMIADIDLKALVVPDNYPYRENPILGFNGITSEEKIGPKMKFTVTLANNIQNSVVLSSKLVIYFPWEIAGNPKEDHGQFMLYLLRTPRFAISTGNKNITCDAQSIINITNIINTRISQDNNKNPKLEDVLLTNVSIPEIIPKLPKLRKKTIFYSKESNSLVKSNWENIVLIDCLNGSARCVPIACDLGPLSRQSGEITLEFDVRIWIHTLVENFIKNKFVYINIPIYWIPLVNYDIVLKDPEGHFKSVRVVAVNFQKPKPPPSFEVVYAVIIAVTVGVLLLASIVIILYKCKFFRRQKIGNRKRK